MKEWILTALTAVVVIIQIIVAVLINYPPTEEQLRVLSLFGMRGFLSLWMLRMISAFILYFIFKVWSKVVSKNIFQWSLLMLLASPAIFGLWYLFPLLTLKALLIVSAWYFISKNSFKRWWLIIFLIVGIICFNRFALNNKAAFFNKLSFKEAQSEVTARFISEDSLESKIELPLWWRRVAYNKYFFVYKEELAEILPFFDLESLFFQEVTPTGQKSMVMWYWPEMYVFIFGIYFCLKKKNKELNKGILIMFLIAITDFVFSEGANYKRLLVAMWPISVLMAIAWDKMLVLSRQKYVLAKWSLGVVGLLLLMAFSFNFYDLKVREEYWFDNRPLAFQFWYQNLSKLDLNKYQYIYVSSLLGDSKSYCNFYLGNICNKNKWTFKNFNLAVDSVQGNTVYAGFAGEFVGPKFKNDIDNNWTNTLAAKKINLVGVRNLRDTIANQYGNEVAVGVIE